MLNSYIWAVHLPEIFCHMFLLCVHKRYERERQKEIKRDILFSLRVGLSPCSARLWMQGELLGRGTDETSCVCSLYQCGSSSTSAVSSSIRIYTQTFVSHSNAWQQVYPENKFSACYWTSKFEVFNVTLHVANYICIRNIWILIKIIIIMISITIVFIYANYFVI